MASLKRFARRLLNAVHPERAERELAREVGTHLSMLEDEYQRRGMTPGDARLAARRAFGGVEAAKEHHRDARSFRWLDETRRDVAFALRMLRRTPGFTAVAILTLALGIGANTAIFSLVNSLMLRALPVVNPERLVTISSGDEPDPRWTYAIWEQVRRRSERFDGAFAWQARRLNLAPGGETEPVDGLFASGDFFSTLGVPALVGRTFTAADDTRGGGRDGPVVVIRYGLWQRRFGGRASVIGKTLVIERVPFTIIGVTPPEFFGAEIGRAFDVALPIGVERDLVRGQPPAPRDWDSNGTRRASLGRRDTRSPSNADCDRGGNGDWPCRRSAVTRCLETMLFGLTPLDPATFIAVSMLLAAVATLASYLPARCATRVDPLVALRHE